MSKVNIVIIGAGEIAVRRHIPALLKGEHTNFYGVFNKHPESTKRIAERHNVYAYLTVDGMTRYSDDGEPKGTAGLPVLNVIMKKELIH